jgi:hypothetical protein
VIAGKPDFVTETPFGVELVADPPAGERGESVIPAPCKEVLFLPDTPAVDVGIILGNAALLDAQDVKISPATTIKIKKYLNNFIRFQSNIKSITG